MFWGLVMEGDKKYSRTCEDGFVVTMAALGEGADAGERAWVYLAVDNKENLLCTLESGKTDQQRIEVAISVGEKISFFTRGTKAKVYLSGFLTRNPLDPLKRAAQAVLDKQQEDAADGEGSDALEEDNEDDEEDEDEDDEDGEDEDEDDDESEDEDDEDAKEEEARALQAAREAEAAAKLRERKEARAKEEQEERAKKKAKQAQPTMPVGRKQFGVDVIDFKEGTGPGAKKGDHVTLKYKGFLKTKKNTDKVFDQGNFDFTLGKDGVIEGWHCGIQGMKLKGQRRLIIPPKLGYGRSGAPPDIPGNATLYFDLLLKNIKPGKGKKGRR